VSKITFAATCALAIAGVAQAGTITLGTFNFNDQQFGNTLIESDGGTFRVGNYLNVIAADPGNPGALTGANFNTGIANVGINANANIDYTIGYSTPIVNLAGNDLGLVVAFSAPGDTFHVAVSVDGTTFTAFQDFAGSGATNTGVSMSYFYGGSGPSSTFLYVIPIDLSTFGIGAGSSIVAVELEGRTGEQPDYIRAAGLNPSSDSAVPEPFSIGLTAVGLAALVYARRRRAV
jgi:hypothetical protein